MSLVLVQEPEEPEQPEPCSAVVALVPWAKGSPLGQRDTHLTEVAQGQCCRAPRAWFVYGSQGSHFRLPTAHRQSAQLRRVTNYLDCPNAGARTGGGALVTESVKPEPTASALLQNAP